ncbi:MFS transporter [Streptomyces sp. CB01881]|uniref:MFS transporter n=1 Tax=Streptomyces sp. CB01881 TaxID=2078691 RepID=UPI0011DF57E5|nr:MFS transporter [Streptomyces sp. CB01881]TYC68187.1 MFS transporter [Streptomyces sp. CB01881]
MNPATHQRLTLAGSITGAAIVALDGTVLTVAQPSMQRDLHASFAAVQWTSTGYLIAVASLLVFAGRLGDRYGHQRVFSIGVLGFAAASAGIAVAPGTGWVVTLRAVQGVAGALLQPATLGMLRAACPADRLAMPIALRTSAIGLAAAAGPLVGGALTAHLGWRAVFLLTVAPAVAAGLLALAVRLPQPPGDRAAGLDLPGAAMLAAALVCLVHTLVGVPEHGWTATTALGLLGAVLLGAAFVRHERRTARPLLPPRVLRSATVGPALGVLLAASAAIFGTLFLATYFLQDVLSLDPLQSALRGLPLAVTMVLAAPASAVLLRRHGARRTVASGMVLIAVGAALASRFDHSSGELAIGGAFLLLGTGFGTVMVTATAVLVRSASVADAGVAGGLQQTAMNIGPALGVAAATTLTAGRPLAQAMGPALLALSGVAALGAVLAGRLPGTRAVAGAAPAPSATPTTTPSTAE